MNNVEANTITAFASLIAQLYEHMHIGDPPKDVPYASGDFYLDDEGYQHWYHEVLRALYEISYIRETWSERALKNELHRLLVDLAQAKDGSEKATQTSIDFQPISTKWLEKFSVEFEEQEYFIPVTGLVAGRSFTIGRITFWPLQEKLAEIQEQGQFQPFSDFSEQQACLASTSIGAESTKGAEILKQKVEEALNVLRYIGALVWYNQSAKHIYLVGVEPKRTSYILTLDSNKQPGWIGDTLYLPYLFNADDRFLSSAKNYRIWNISKWLVDPVVTPLQQVLLGSIQWFGDATQELSPLQAFIKYYIAIEALLKADGEDAKSVLPKRITTILGQRGKEKRKIRKLISERNAVFHEGQPKNDSAEILGWISHQLARNVINKIVQKVYLSQRLPQVSSATWRTKEGMIGWIDKRKAPTP